MFSNSQNQLHDKSISNKKPWCELSILENKVVKKQEKKITEIEIEKTISGRKIGLETGLFSVPEILQTPESNTIEFERLHGLLSIREYSKKKIDLIPLFESIGKSLAEVHKKLEVTENLSKKFPEAYVSPDDKDAFLHGDFNVINIQVVEETGELVILDWSTSHVFDKEATVGSIYVDMFFFIHTLFYGKNISPFSSMTVKNEELSNSFLKGYFTISPEMFDYEELKEFFNIYFNIFYKRHRDEKGLLRFSLYKANFLLFKKYILKNMLKS